MDKRGEVPEAEADDDLDADGDGENPRMYFPSLTDSLRSATVDPNPIRGYD